jgi:phospholipid transport system substrate-binding protein
MTARAPRLTLSLKHKTFSRRRLSQHPDTGGGYMETKGSAAALAKKWGWAGIVSAIACLLLLHGGLTVQPAVAGGATEAMKSTIDEALKIIQNKDLKQPGRTEERRRQLEQVVGDRFDYQEMSRRTLGAPWNALPDKDKEEFVALFKTLLTNSYADKIESYSGEGVQYINERTEKDYAEVRTKVLTGKVEIPLDYRLLNKGADWRVYDVVVDGVSLVNNYRGQFSKILRSSTYADLVDQLRKKSDKIKAQ